MGSLLGPCPGKERLGHWEAWACPRVWTEHLSPLLMATEERCRPGAITHGWSMCLRSLMGASSLSCSSRLHLSCPATGGMFLWIGGMLPSAEAAIWASYRILVLSNSVSNSSSMTEYLGTTSARIRGRSKRPPHMCRSWRETRDPSLPGGIHLLPYAWHHPRLGHSVWSAFRSRKTRAFNTSKFSLCSNWLTSCFSDFQLDVCWVPKYSAYKPTVQTRSKV